MPNVLNSSRAYFERLDEVTFRPTEHVAGAWEVSEQHIAPAMGLVAHAVLNDHAARRATQGAPPLQLSRLSCEILGTLQIEPFELTVTVLRPGRTIELVEARLAQGGRDGVLARAWFVAAYDTAAMAGTALARIGGPAEMAPVQPSEQWPGGFIRSIELRRNEVEPGRASFWVRSGTGLVAGEETSDTARLLALVDVANGMTTRVPIDQAYFPNVDWTAHLFRAPAGEWVGLDTTVTFGASGVGLTSSVLHDETGPFGTLAQSLTIRPRA